MPAKARWRNFSKEEIINIVNTANCLGDIAEALGYKRDSTTPVMRCLTELQIVNPFTEGTHIAKWRSYTANQLQKIINQSQSIAEVATKLGYDVGGGTYQSIAKMIEENNLDTSSLKGQGWNKDNLHLELFTNNYKKKNGKTTRETLIKIRGHRCEHCGLTEWLGQPINLQVHHKDGNHQNNSLDNLELVCPNCHSYTNNFCMPKAYLNDTTQ